MEFEERGSFNFKGSEIKVFKVDFNISGTRKDEFEKLINKFFNRERNKYKIYRCYEFYDANGDFIEQSDFQNNLGTDYEFKFVVEDRASNLRDVLKIDHNEFLNDFNDSMLVDSKYVATDVFVFSDDKPDNIKITFQIKLENK